MVDAFSFKEKDISEITSSIISSESPDSLNCFNLCLIASISSHVLF